jgi:hypothetical protein
MASNGGLMDRNVPSQMDEADLAAEIEIELPGSMEDDRFQMMDETGGDIEITQMDDGGVEVDFDPSDQRGENEDFYANLAGRDAGPGAAAHFGRAFV